VSGIAGATKHLRGRSVVALFVVAIAIVVWQCNYSGSCTRNTDCTGTNHVCVFRVSDGCGGDGHCAPTSECASGAFTLRGCGCDGSPAFSGCVEGGGYDRPVRSTEACSQIAPPIGDASDDAASFAD
jgi:hypothetical protein